jgi:hypothetical protein
MFVLNHKITKEGKQKKESMPRVPEILNLEFWSLFRISCFGFRIFPYKDTSNLCELQVTIEAEKENDEHIG